jgi:hypothetical protein
VSSQRFFGCPLLMISAHQRAPQFIRHPAAGDGEAGHDTPAACVPDPLRARVPNNDPPQQTNRSSKESADSAGEEIQDQADAGIVCPEGAREVRERLPSHRVVHTADCGQSGQGCRASPAEAAESPADGPGERKGLCQLHQDRAGYDAGVGEGLEGLLRCQPGSRRGPTGFHEGYYMDVR